MRREMNRPDTRALCHIGLDAALDRDQLEELARHTDVITVSRGTLLARAGRTPRQFVAVIDGHVDVTDSSGRAYVAGPGAHIGGAELRDRRPHDATFVARSTCRLVVIVGQALTATFRHPGVASWAEHHSVGTQTIGDVVARDTTRHLALVN